MSAAAPPALRVSDLAKSFRGSAVLRGISLQVCVGERLGIVGDNGSGKSTLLKCIAGEERQDVGSVELFGQTLVAGSPRSSRSLGLQMLSQFPEFADDLSAFENAIFLREPISSSTLAWFDVATARTRLHDVMLDLTDSPINIEKPICFLSGGQKKLIALARCLLAEPKLLLLDEPTAALGKDQQAKLLRFLKNGQLSELTLVIVSHDEAFLREICDRIVMVKYGSLEANI